MLLSWRWLDRERGTWTGLVRYQREGLLYEHWVHGDLLAVSGHDDAPAETAGGIVGG